MKRIILIGGLSAFVASVVPIASANATENGRCTIHGKATVEEALTRLPEMVKYGLVSEAGGPLHVPAEGVECVEEGTGTRLTGTTRASGEGEVACTFSAGNLKEVEPVLLGQSSAPAEGKLELGYNAATKKYEKIFEYELSLVSAAGIIDFLVRPKGAATFTVGGFASFLASEHEEVGTCFTTSAGVRFIEFDATAEGQI
jgi:hypothetical protein